MELKNPLQFSYTHPNFQGQRVNVALTLNDVIPSFLDLKAEGINGATGYAQLQFQDNGTVTIRIDEDPANLFTVTSV